MGCLAALGWRVPGTLDTLSAACRGPLRAVAPRGLSSHLRDPLKPCAPGWPLHPLWRGAGQLSPLSQGFPRGTAQRGDTQQIAGAPAELTVFWEMLLKPADCVWGGAGGILEAVGSSGHPSPLPLHPDSPAWPKLASWPPCSPPESCGLQRPHGSRWPPGQASPDVRGWKSPCRCSVCALCTLSTSSSCPGRRGPGVGAHMEGSG